MIVATIGPATQSEEIITDLIIAGVTTFRLNFSHGDHKDHAERIKTIRQVSTKLDIDERRKAFKKNELVAIFEIEFEKIYTFSNIKFHLLILFGVIYYSFMLGWVGNTRYFMPSWIFSSIFFGMGFYLIEEIYINYKKN